ncbi:MAG TPA: molybdopterin-binding/glycosyltransferase family 2 protein [Geminicoccus sp.]|jgi:molybdenum cofactor cytidylyltransferase|uniref:molybdopterin-binding/glycosyltransferase family 2 protein n=1 Tax=Geminicoccus sp. TaxID=2024832 RepID=UPI002E30F993|nr:molybdopterin-binding/glycosyltransferase family 2 protein [Geminicoccus sp.]HEX2527730.1 molybdopterin-binding/glycosyltransferase family 2 protein [Geminicoccus sp.]
MFFGNMPLRDALGATLAHGVKFDKGGFKKGRRLGEADIAKLGAAGVTEVSAVRFNANDVQEDEAAERLARAIAGLGLTVAEPFTGRSNLFAAEAGIVLLELSRLHQLNRIDPDLTVATLPPFARVAAKDMVATVKVIPFATSRDALDRCLTLAGDGPLLRLAPFKGLKARLVQSRTSATSDKLLDKTVEVTRQRLQSVGGSILGERRCPHTTDGIAEAVRASLDAGGDIVLIAGASAVTDRRDVLPSGIEAAGGVVEHVGMPVDPGNLLVFGRHGDIPVIGLPGCARSIKLNGFDWVLERLAAGVRVTPSDIMAMGVGGLLSEIPSRPQPRGEARPADRGNASMRAPRITALVLAAGRSSRMGPNNKLLIPLEGKPLVRHVVDAVLSSACEQVVVVTGHMREQVTAVLDGLPVLTVHNADFARGLASSLATGLKAVPADADGVIVLLGDMPKVDRKLIDRMIAAFSPADGRSIVVPVVNGKRGNPVLWSASYFARMTALEGDTGAKALIGENEQQVVEIAADDDAPLVDLDTPEALAAYLDDRP